MNRRSDLIVYLLPCVNLSISKYFDLKHLLLTRGLECSEAAEAEEAEETVQCTVQLPDAVAATIKDTINVNGPFLLLLVAALPYNTFSIFAYFLEYEDKCERLGNIFYVFGIVNYLTWALYYTLVFKIFTKNA